LKVNKYYKNTIVLITGAGLSQLMSFIALPLLARVYSAGQLGSFFLYLALSSVFSSFVSLQSHLTIVLGRSQSIAKLNMTISVMLNMVTHSLFFIVLSFVQEMEYPFLANIDLEYLRFIPVASFLLSIQLAQEGYQNYKQNYKKISRLRAIRMFLMLSAQLLIPFLIPADGLILIWAHLLSLGLMNLVYGLDTGLIVKHLSLKGIESYLKEYWLILRYNTGISFINTSSNQLPIVLIKLLFGIEAAGFYGMASRIAGTPFSLVGQNMGFVFYQKAASFYKYGKHLKVLVLKTIRSLAIIGSIPFLIFLLFSNSLLIFFLGDEWSQTGITIQIISPWLFVGYINMTISSLTTVLSIQKRMIIYEIALLLGRAIALYTGFIILESYMGSLLGLSFVGVVFNIISISLLYKYSLKANEIKKSYIG